MPRRRAVNLLKNLFGYNEFSMLKIQRLRQLGGCHRFARCKGCHAKNLCEKIIVIEPRFAARMAFGFQLLAFSSAKAAGIKVRRGSWDACRRG